MTNRVFPRLLRAGAAFAAAAALVMTGALTATSAHAAVIDKPLALTAAPQATTVAAFTDVAIDISWTGCFVSELGLEELTGGAWTKLGVALESSGQIQSTCASATSTGSVKLLSMLDFAESLSAGPHILRLTGHGWDASTPTGDRWKIGDGASNQFQLNVVQAQTTFTGWTNQTVTLKPGASYTLPAISVTNPGGYENPVIIEADEGHGWYCYSFTCDTYKQFSNETSSPAAQTITNYRTRTLPIRFRYRVPANDYVSGGVSPVFAVKFTNGISKSKATKVSVKVSGSQVYGKSQATLKATVNSSKASGLLVFTLFKRTSVGALERVYVPFEAKVVSKGQVKLKPKKTAVPRGSYVLVGTFLSKNPKKYRDSVKSTSFTVK